MKILIAVKRVVDPYVRLRLKSDGSGVDTENVKMSMNPFDRHGVEAAVQLAETHPDTEIVAVTIGTEKARDVLLAAMAMGAHRAVHLVTEDALEPLAVARLLARIIDEESPDLVLAGKQAVDDDCQITAQLLAGLLDWPLATSASFIEISEGVAAVTREMAFGRQNETFDLPGIITADLALNLPRNTTLPNVMRARKKPLATRPVAQFGLDLAPRIHHEKTAPPPARGGGVALSDTDELADFIAGVTAQGAPQ
jgi:electron transfer flavoprotein beta subunit